MTIDDLLKNSVIVEGFRGTICIEIGGPEPDVRCAERGIIVGIEVLQKV